jgi:hypothetical protein
MTAAPTTYTLRRVSVLLRGEAEPIRGWVERSSAGQVARNVVVIVAGAALYGAAMGAWRAPLQGLFCAVKFPLILLLTALGNALLNAMLAPLLGLNLSLRQSLMAVLMSFTIAATILGSFAPLVGFLVWNAPPLSADLASSRSTHAFILLTHVAVIALAGIAANVRLVQLLRRLSGNGVVASRVLFAWLAVNLLLGSQLSWNLRPFIGSPGLPVEFLRQTALEGNFFEAVLHAARRLLDFI